MKKILLLLCVAMGSGLEASGRTLVRSTGSKKLAPSTSAGKDLVAPSSSAPERLKRPAPPLLSASPEVRKQYDADLAAFNAQPAEVNINVEPGRPGARDLSNRDATRNTFFGPENRPADYVAPAFDTVLSPMEGTASQRDLDVRSDSAGEVLAPPRLSESSVNSQSKDSPVVGASVLHLPSGLKQEAPLRYDTLTQQQINALKGEKVTYKRLDERTLADDVASYVAMAEQPANARIVREQLTKLLEGPQRKEVQEAFAALAKENPALGQQAALLQRAVERDIKEKNSLTTKAKVVAATTKSTLSRLVKKPGEALHRLSFDMAYKNTQSHLEKSTQQMAELVQTQEKQLDLARDVEAKKADLAAKKEALKKLKEKTPQYEAPIPSWIASQFDGTKKILRADRLAKDNALSAADKAVRAAEKALESAEKKEKQHEKVLSGAERKAQVQVERVAQASQELNRARADIATDTVRNPETQAKLLSKAQKAIGQDAARDGSVAGEVAATGIFLEKAQQNFSSRLQNIKSSKQPKEGEFQTTADVVGMDAQLLKQKQTTVPVEQGKVVDWGATPKLPVQSGAESVASSRATVPSMRDRIAAMKAKDAMATPVLGQSTPLPAPKPALPTPPPLPSRANKPVSGTPPTPGIKRSVPSLPPTPVAPVAKGPDRDAAATKIQSVVRGRQARKTVETTRGQRAKVEISPERQALIDAKIDVSSLDGVDLSSYARMLKNGVPVGAVMQKMRKDGHTEVKDLAPETAPAPAPRPAPLKQPAGETPAPVRSPLAGQGLLSGIAGFDRSKLKQAPAKEVAATPKPAARLGIDPSALREVKLRSTKESAAEAPKPVIAPEPASIFKTAAAEARKQAQAAAARRSAGEVALKEQRKAFKQLAEKFTDAWGEVSNPDKKAEILTQLPEATRNEFQRYLENPKKYTLSEEGASILEDVQKIITEQSAPAPVPAPISVPAPIRKTTPPVAETGRGEASPTGVAESLTPAATPAPKPAATPPSVSVAPLLPRLPLPGGNKMESLQRQRELDLLRDEGDAGDDADWMD